MSFDKFLQKNVQKLRKILLCQLEFDSLGVVKKEEKVVRPGKEEKLFEKHDKIKGFNLKPREMLQKSILVS